MLIIIYDNSTIEPYNNRGVPSVQYVFVFHTHVFKILFREKN